MACGSSLCCSFPNGFLTLAPCILSTAAFVLSSVSLWSCRYAETPSGVGAGLILRETTLFDESYGKGGVCTLYSWAGIFSEEEGEGMIGSLDGTFRSAQSFGVAAWCLGFVMAAATWIVAPCVPAARIGWRIIGGLYFIIGSFQALALTFLSSNICSHDGDGCTLRGGGIVGIVSFLLWFGIAIIACWFIPEAKGADEPASVVVVAQEMVPVETSEPAAAIAAREITTQRMQSDGTTVVEKTITYPDGRTVVEQSVFPPTKV